MSHNNTDCLTCVHCRNAKVANGRVPFNWRHICTKIGVFLITTKRKGIIATGILQANTCPDYELKENENA